MRKDLLHDLYRRDDGMPKSLRDLLERDEMELGDARLVLDSIFLPKETDEDRERDGLEPDPYTESLAGAKKGWGPAAGNTLRVNTYPFGAPTRNIFKEFVGVCAGKRSLSKALDAVVDYCEKVRRFYDRQAKTVILLTDKWDWLLFHRKYEIPFLRFALDDNVLFLFLLVTDYGVSRIPFLAKNHMELENLRRKGYAIENDAVGCSDGCCQDTLGDAAGAISACRGRNGMLSANPKADGLAYGPDCYQDHFNHYLEHLKRHDPFILERRSASREPFSGLAPGEIRYEFILRQRCCVVREGTQTPQMKRISPDGLKEFARVLMQWEDEFRCGYEWRYGGPAPDSAYCAAELLGNRVIWDPAVLDGLSQPVKEVVDALEKLADSLKEMQ